MRLKYATFGDWLLLHGRQQSTIDGHIKRIAHIIDQVGSIDLFSVDTFILKLKKNGIKNNSINSYIDTIRLYAQFTGLEESVCNYRHLKKNNTLKAVLNNDEIEELVSLPCPKFSNPVQWETWSKFFGILSVTGMRPGELANMTANEIDMGRNVFMIRNSKTGYPRLVPIPPNYKLVMENLVRTCNGYLFRTNVNRPISENSWGHAFKKRLNILDIHRTNLSLYSLRHSYITTQLELDTNIHKIAKLVGHSIQMTAKYEHLNTKDIEAVIRKHPLVRKYTDPSEILDCLKDFIVDLKIKEDKRFSISMTEKSDGISLEVNINKPSH